MEKIRIEEEFKDFNEYSINENLVILFEIISTKGVEHAKLSICIFLLVFFIFMTVFDYFDIKNGVSLKPLKKYIRDCKKLILYNRIRLYNKNPFLSICLPVLNMEKVIERSLFSIINQSFQDFEIIIVNDASKDNTENIIKKIQAIYPRIKLLIHEKAFGVYRSRFEAILNSKGEYILLMDPDDMYLNENLFYKLFSYYINYNIDIIEFSVYKQDEGSNKIYLPKTDFEIHYHKFNKEIIYQPELSNILYYDPSTKEYSRTICRNIWNKMIKKKVFIKTKKYIGKKYYKLKLITSDDMMMNIIAYQFAANYSNINYPGYLYIRRKKSMSRGGGKKLKKIRAKNFYYYFKLFYRNIRDHDKDINILLYEMINLERFILYIKKGNMTRYVKKHLKLMKKILTENILSIEFETYLLNLSKYFKKGST